MHSEGLDPEGRVIVGRRLLPVTERLAMGTEELAFVHLPTDLPSGPHEVHP